MGRNLLPYCSVDPPLQPCPAPPPPHSHIWLQVFYVAPNIYAVTYSCGWLLSPTRVFGIFRWLFLAAFLCNQVLQALTLLPIAPLLPLLRRARLLRDGVVGPDGQSHILMARDLPRKVYLAVVSGLR